MSQWHRRSELRINPIGAYVLEEACKRCKYWNDMGHPDYKVNVNRFCGN